MHGVLLFPKISGQMEQANATEMKKKEPNFTVSLLGLN